MQNPLINSLKSDIARLDAKLQESSVNLGRNHPQTQRTQSELASLRNRLASETRQIHNSISTSYEVGKHKEEELLEAIERQKARVLELNKQRDQISVLQRDVEAAQRNFEAVSQRSAHTRLESLAVQTNICDPESGFNTNRTFEAPNSAQRIDLHISGHVARSRHRFDA